MTGKQEERTGQPQGLRELHKWRTRDSIRQAALNLFEQHGYENTTVEQIAQEAEVSHTTFFRHFQSKAMVILADDLDQARIEVVASIPPGLSPFDLLRFVLTRFAPIAAADPWFSNRRRKRLIMSEPALLEIFRSEAEQTVSRAIDYLARYTGRNPDDFALRVFVGAVGGILAEIMDLVACMENAEDTLTTMLNAIDLLEQGVPL